MACTDDKAANIILQPRFDWRHIVRDTEVSLVVRLVHLLSNMMKFLNHGIAIIVFIKKDVVVVGRVSWPKAYDCIGLD